MAAEEITDVVKKRKKLLHLGGTELQEVAYQIPGAILTVTEGGDDNIFKTLVGQLTEYFSPK